MVAIVPSWKSGASQLSSCVCLFHQEQKLSLPKAWVIWLSWNTKGAGKANIQLARLCSEKVRGRKRVRMTLGLSASRVCHSGIRGPLMSREQEVLPTKSLAVLYWKKLKRDGSQRLEVKFSLLSERQENMIWLTRSYAWPLCNSSIFIAGSLHVER